MNKKIYSNGYNDDDNQITIYYTQTRPDCKHLKKKIEAFEVLFESKAKVIVFGTFFEADTRLDVYCGYGAKLISIGKKYIVVETSDGQFKVDPTEGKNDPVSYSGLYKLVIRKED